jgi:hypothetical protein
MRYQPDNLEGRQGSADDSSITKKKRAVLKKIAVRKREVAYVRAMQAVLNDKLPAYDALDDKNLQLYFSGTKQIQKSKLARYKSQTNLLYAHTFPRAKKRRPRTRKLVPIHAGAHVKISKEGGGQEPVQNCWTNNDSAIAVGPISIVRPDAQQQSPKDRPANRNDPSSALPSCKQEGRGESTKGESRTTITRTKTRRMKVNSLAPSNVQSSGNSTRPGMREARTHISKHKRFPATVMVVVALKRWSHRARLTHWERVQAGITNSLDLTLHTTAGCTEWLPSTHGRKVSLMSRNVVVRSPMRAMGTLLRSSVTIDEEDESLTLHSHVYSTGARAEAKFTQLDWAAFNPKSLKSMMHDEKMELADRLIAMHKLDAESRQSGQGENREELRGFPLMRAIAKENPSVMEKVVAIMKTRCLVEGNQVFNVGDLGDGMYFILSGSLSVHHEDGTAMALLRKGQYFGEVALLKRHGKRTATIRCKSHHVKVATISRSQFDALCRNCPGISDILDSFTKDVYDANDRERQRGLNLMHSGSSPMFARRSPPTSRTSPVSPTTHGNRAMAVRF